MKILNAEFVRSIADARVLGPESVPEFCFIGRSNVGKSSLINNLVARKIARTSSTPGATRLINIFDVHYESMGERRHMVFSDFPGFGFSKVSRSVSRNWKSMIEGYVLKNKNIRRIIWLFDVRREMDDLDQTLLEWLLNNGFEFYFVLTKSDKDKQGNVAAKRKFFNEYFKGIPVLLYSSKTGQGKNELLSAIENTIR